MRHQTPPSDFASPGSCVTSEDVKRVNRSLVPIGGKQDLRAGPEAESRTSPHGNKDFLQQIDPSKFLPALSTGASSFSFPDLSDPSLNQGGILDFQELLRNSRELEGLSAQSSELDQNIGQVQQSIQDLLTNVPTGATLDEILRSIPDSHHQASIKEHDRTTSPSARMEEKPYMSFMSPFGSSPVADGHPLGSATVDDFLIGSPMPSPSSLSTDGPDPISSNPHPNPPKKKRKSEINATE